MIASEVTIESRDRPALQSTNAAEPELAPSEALAEPQRETNTDGGKGKMSQGELGEAEMEESGSYIDDFTLDDNDGKRSGNQEGVEESGSYYCDDFADDGEEPLDEDDPMEDNGENHKGSDKEPSVNAEVLSTGVAAATPDIIGGSGGNTTGSADEPVAAETNTGVDPGCVPSLPKKKNDIDGSVHDTAVSEVDGAGLDGAHCSSDTPPDKVPVPRESPAVSVDDETRNGDKPQLSAREDVNTGLISSSDCLAVEEREVEENYEKEISERDEEQAESATPVDVQWIQPGVSSKTEESGSSSVEFTGVGDATSTTQTQQSESYDEGFCGVESDEGGEETAPKQHTTLGKESLQGDDEHAESATPVDVQWTQQGASSKTEGPGCSSVEFTGAGDAASTTQTQQSESYDEGFCGVESDDGREETGPEQHTQSGKNDQRSSSEAANNLRVPDETKTGGSDGDCGVSNAELVAEVTGQEVVDNSQPGLVADADDHRAQTSPPEPAPTPIAVDPSTNEKGSSADEGYGSECDEAVKEDFKDDFEASEEHEDSPEPQFDPALLAYAVESIFALLSGPSESESETGAQSMPSTAVGVAENIGEERISTTELAKPAVIEESASPVERRRSSEGGAPSASIASEDGFEESYEDDTADNDTVRSAEGGESTHQARAAGTIAPAPEPGREEVDTGGDPDGEHSEVNGAVPDKGSAVGLAKGRALKIEDGEFEEDFEEEFEEDTDGGIASGQPSEEDMAADVVVGLDQDPAIIDGEEIRPVQQDHAGFGKVSDSEVSNSPASTAPGGGGGGGGRGEGGGELRRGDGDEDGGQHKKSQRVEEAVEIPPPTEEVRCIRTQSSSFA